MFDKLMGILFDGALAGMTVFAMYSLVVGITEIVKAVL